MNPLHKKLGEWGEIEEASSFYKKGGALVLGFTVSSSLEATPHYQFMIGMFDILPW